ncbi:MAG: 6-carboxytetrahydropterin synthase [Elusimicrobia bacterium]|nr:6-carboxytetrahydropterin synthase [Elusimicrobiota bacterium]
MTYTVTKRIHFCYGHRLLDYAGKCRHLHGHNAAAELSFSRRFLDRRGMALDFADIKETVQAWVDAELDHRLLLNRRDPLARLLRGAGEPVVTLPGNPTAENIAKLLFDFAAGRKLPVVRVRLWENPDSCAEYAP